MLVCLWQIKTWNQSSCAQTVMVKVVVTECFEVALCCTHLPVLQESMYVCIVLSVSLLGTQYQRTYVLPLLLVSLFFISPQISEPVNGRLVSILEQLGVFVCLFILFYFFISFQISELVNGRLVSILRQLGVWCNFNIP